MNIITFFSHELMEMKSDYVGFQFKVAQMEESQKVVISIKIQHGRKWGMAEKV